MAIPESELVIIEEDNCPLYEVGDRFFLTGNATLISSINPREFVVTAVVRIPIQKKICKILMGDITRVLIKYDRIDKIPSFYLSCTGCQGNIRIAYHKKLTTGTSENFRNHTSKINEIIGILKNFEIFKELNDEQLKQLVLHLRLKKYNPSDLIIRKGEPGKNLYIITSGQVEVLDENENQISVLNQGEIFGEMSLITGENVGATIRATSALSVLYINSRDFNKDLEQYPQLQMYFARMLTQRLNRLNLDRSDDFSSGMFGKLSEIPPAELFQLLNISQKTGVLQLIFSRDTALLSFREGELLKAQYGEKIGKEAFFALFEAPEGRFKFIPKLPPDDLQLPSMGCFMELLMEGLRKMDEFE